jgi:glyoxylase-like metal-dependent hydrolase (beta-lactamase superfamily II)
MDLRIISIGCLDAHPLWDERAAARTGHATTTLIRLGSMVLLVDPGLPSTILEARLSERANLKPKDVTHVFLTSFRPDVRRGLPLFQSATWWVSEAERESVGVPLIDAMKRAHEVSDRQLEDLLRQDIAWLHRCEAAPDRLVRSGGSRVDLFPLPGVTPGLAGLVVAEPSRTTVICGDAIPTVEHLERGQVLKNAHDGTKAQESFSEVLEIADQIVLGRDNIVMNPTRRMV